MKLTPLTKRATISLLAAGYYIGVVYATGLSTRPATMTEFFGHALIYAAAVGLVSSLFFISERSASKKREEEFCATALGETQHRRSAEKTLGPTTAANL